MSKMKNRTDTKRVLIDSVKELLCQNESFTVKEISEKAFTNVAAINYHFGDKDSLVRIALNELLEEFKQTILTEFNREFPTGEAALEQVLQFLFETYSRYKGAIKYILLFKDPAVETRLVEKFFFDTEFIEAFMQRLSETTGETDTNLLFYRLSIVISALLFPLLIEGSGKAASDRISLTALQNEENKKAFISTLMLLFR